MNQQILRRLDDVIQSNILGNSTDPDCIVGAAISVIKSGKEVFRNQYGMADKENKIPMQKDSIFRCYSMTKPVTAVAVMTLLEKGLLSLTDKASQYLPGFANQKVYTPDGLVPVETEVTIQHLLDMTAGVCYPDASFPAGKYMEDQVQTVFYEKLAQGEDTSTYDLANLIGQQPLAFQPGTDWNYSFCADILGAIVEVITGMRYGQYLKKTIFEPLGMVDTDFYVPKEKQHRLMVNYQYMPETQTLEPCTWQHLCLSHFHLSPPAFESGGAGLVSTIDDYTKFVRMLMNKGSYNGVRILGRKTVEWMTRDHIDKSHFPGFNWEQLQGYGYGNLNRIMVHPEHAQSFASLGEYGWDGWLGCYMFVDPLEDLAVVYAIQKCGGNGFRDIQAIRNVIYAALD